MGMSFTIAAGPRQRSHSWVRVPWDSFPHFTLSDSRLPQPAGPGPSSFIPQEEGGPVIPPRHWVPFSSPPTTRRVTVEVFDPAFIRVEMYLNSPIRLYGIRKLSCWRLMWNCSYSSTIFDLSNTWRWGQLHALAALPSGKEPSGVLWIGRCPESVWTLWRREKSYTAGNRNRFVEEIAIMTALFRILLYGFNA
jgi:hypothetical protein